jgi:hypothetical protein
MYSGGACAQKAPPAPWLQTTKADPFHHCVALEKRLPARLPDLRRIGAVEKETVRPDQDYCQRDLSQCEIRHLTFPGLEIDVLVRKQTQQVSVLTLRLSSDQWDLLQPVRVGGSLAEIERHHGVNVPAKPSPVRIAGDCSYIDVTHKQRRVVDVFLDCQACI